MRRNHWVWLAIFLTACGSTPTADMAPPPAPPPAIPASITVGAGDGQQAVPGAPVPLPVSVIVKSSAGTPLAGISVAFTVDSGGGVVTGGSEVTNASGVAVLGSWTLGPAGGRNVLRVQVTGVPPLLVSATAVVPASGRVADVSIGASGGTITSSVAPLAGFALTIPTGAFSSAGHWTIEFQPASTGPQSPNFRVAAPLLAITTDQGMANALITLRIPVTVPADSFALASYYDPATGYLEPLPILAEDASSITVAVRHFSADLLGQRASLRSTQRTTTTLLFNALRATGAAYVATTMQSLGTVAASLPAVSDFAPGVDDWEFADHGSYVTPSGNSTGMALSELYYYMALKPPLFTGPSLYGKYDLGPLWQDNPLGYRVAALAESDASWPQAAALIQSMAPPSDGLEFHSAAAAISYTHRPLLIGMTGPGGTVALIAYQISANEILAADPNNPGLPVHIRFIGNQFQPLQLPGCAGACPRTFTTFRVIGVTSLVNIKGGGTPGRFAQLAAGQVGAQEFPAYTLQYYDQVSGLFTDLTTKTLAVGWQNLQLRAKCFSCVQTLPGGMASLAIYSAGGALIASDQTVGNVQFTIPPGNDVIGIHILGGLPDPLGGGTVWRHVDFQYITFSSSKISISPNPANGLSGVPLSLTATNQAATPAQVRYIWNFNDGTVATIDNNNVVSHTWVGAGNYPVSVLVKDLVTGGTVGSAAATVQIDQPVPVWRFDTYVTSGYSQPAGLQNLGNYGYAFSDGNQDADFTDGLPASPGSGLIVFQPTAVIVGNVTYPAGLYLQFAGLGFPRTGFDPVTAKVRLLIAGGSAGNLMSGTFVGQNIGRTFGHFGLPFDGAPETEWSVSATKNGNRLTGTIVRTEHVWDSAGGVDFLLGDIVFTQTFTATRLK